MEALLTSTVCARDCDKHPLVTITTDKPANADELVAQIRASLDSFYVPYTGIALRNSRGEVIGRTKSRV